MKKFVCKQVIYYFCSRKGKCRICRLLQTDIILDEVDVGDLGITNNELSLDGLTTDVGGDGVGSFLRDTRLELVARAVIGRR